MSGTRPLSNILLEPADRETWPAFRSELSVAQGDPFRGARGFG
jgi:hypothetical protein